MIYFSKEVIFEEGWILSQTHPFFTSLVENVKKIMKQVVTSFLFMGSNFWKSLLERNRYLHISFFSINVELLPPEIKLMKDLFHFYFLNMYFMYYCFSINNDKFEHSQIKELFGSPLPKIAQKSIPKYIQELP